MLGDHRGQRQPHPFRLQGTLTMSELLWRQTQSSPLARAMAAGNLLEARRLLSQCDADVHALAQARLLDDPACHLLLREKTAQSTELLVGSRLEPWLQHVQTQQRGEVLALRLSQTPSENASPQNCPSRRF